MGKKEINLGEQLGYREPNVYDVVSIECAAEITAYAEEYKQFLNCAKTEREVVAAAVRMARQKGYEPYSFGMKPVVGGKYYFVNHKKSLCLFVIGTEPLESGVNMAVSHIDSPRVDLKQKPLYEEKDLCYFKTHYYGGVKKYQWATIPLALHGVVVKEDGSTVDIVVGEDEGDPVFYISDLMPHIAKDQMKLSMAEAFPGEKLNIVIGSQPIACADERNAVKLHVLHLLHEKYGITEGDFISAEICAVPAFKARDVGFDRSLIAAYGHDDRVCAYPAITALLNQDKPKHTAMVLLADKEEVFSDGNTSIKSAVFMDLFSEIASAMGANEHIMRANSKCISADVNGGFDPNFPEVNDIGNTAVLNHGVVLTKYCGTEGKYKTNDADAEILGYMRRVMHDAGVVYQCSEFGKSDQGGAETLAKYVSSWNVSVVDIGVPVISMHAPYELIAKADLYMEYKAIDALFSSNIPKG